MATLTTGVPTPECDKEIAAREVKIGGCTAFLAWLDEKGWLFCTHGGDGWNPVQTGVVRKFLPDPPDGGSQEIGDFVEECEECGLTLCQHLKSNHSDLVREMQSTPEGRRELKTAFYSVTIRLDYQPKGWYPLFAKVEDLLALYFSIDLAAASRERDAILAAYRASGAKGEE
jgi:hypothetical protein